tara:strand:+ start:457 stop:600 length:144 start_codon:yes stop_codon:yes gene_type:complete
LQGKQKFGQTGFKEYFSINIKAYPQLKGPLSLLKLRVSAKRWANSDS